MKKDIVEVEDLPVEFKKTRTRNIDYSSNSLASIMDGFEKEIFIDAFKKYRTSIAVGRALGISQTTAARKLRKYIPDYVSQRLSDISQE